jgi:hypothetical protein
VAYGVLMFLVRFRDRRRDARRQVSTIIKYHCWGLSLLYTESCFGVVTIGAATLGVVLPVLVSCIVATVCIKHFVRVLVVA